MRTCFIPYSEWEQTHYIKTLPSGHRTQFDLSSPGSVEQSFSSLEDVITQIKTSIIGRPTSPINSKWKFVSAIRKEDIFYPRPLSNTCCSALLFCQCIWRDCQVLCWKRDWVWCWLIDAALIALMPPVGVWLYFRRWGSEMLCCDVRLILLQLQSHVLLSIAYFWIAFLDRFT